MEVSQTVTVDDIVTDYILNYREALHEQMLHFEKEQSLHYAIRHAALSVGPDGKRHPHQRRRRAITLQDSAQRLHRCARELQSAHDFAALHRIIENEIDTISGIGALTVYDVAHRIGAYLGKAPELVYLHSGTKAGAAVFGLQG